MMIMPEVLFTNVPLVDQTLQTEVLPRNYYEAYQERAELDTLRPPLGLTMRTGIYRDCLSTLALARYTEDPPLESRRTKTWAPNNADTPDLQAELAPQRRTLELLNNIDDYAAKGKYKDGLREEQVELFEEMLGRFDDAKHIGECQAGVLAAPGIGKTHLITEFLRAVHNKERAAEQDNPIQVRSLVLTEDQDLVRQNSGQDGIHGIKTFAPELNVGVYYAKEKDPFQEVTVMTYASFVRASDDGLIRPEDYDVILSDEADLALSYRRFPRLREFQEGKISFGFTATDADSKYKHLGMLYDTIITGPNMAEGMDGGMLAPAQIWHVASDEELILPNAAKALPDIPDHLLEPLAHRAGRDKIAIEYATLLTQELGTIGTIECLAGADCEHAYDLARQLREVEIYDYEKREYRKIRAEGVHGLNPDREDIFARFNRGEIDWITTVDLGTRGKDNPKASGYIGLRPHYTMRRATQARGRPARLDPDDPDKVAQYVEIVDTVRFEDGERLNPPRTMYHVLGLTEFEQGATYGRIDKPSSSNTQKLLPYHRIPESLRELLERTSAGRVLDYRGFGQGNRLQPPQPGYVSARSLEAQGVPGTGIKTRMKSWGVETKYFLSPENGSRAVYLPEDVAADIIELYTTPKDEHALKRAAFPPATWRQIRGREEASPRSTIDITDKAQKILQSQGVPEHVVRPRVFSLSGKANEDYRYYSFYSPRQLKTLETIADELPEAPWDSRHFSDPLRQSTTPYLARAVKNYDGTPYVRNYNLSQAKSPLGRRAHTAIQNTLQTVDDMYAKTGITNRLQRKKERGITQVDNFVTRDEQRALLGAVREIVPVAEDEKFDLVEFIHRLRVDQELSDDEKYLGHWNYLGGRQDHQRLRDAIFTDPPEISVMSRDYVSSSNDSVRAGLYVDAQEAIKLIKKTIKRTNQQEILDSIQAARTSIPA